MELDDEVEIVAAKIPAVGPSCPTSKPIVLVPSTSKFIWECCWYLTGERPCWRCYCKSKGCLWNGVSVRTQKKRPPLAALVVAKRIKLVQAAKAFLEQQGKPSQFFILEGYKGKGKAKALVEDSETMGAKQSFKSRELVDSDSDKEEEEDRVHVIKKIKHEHVEEPTGTKRRKEIMELDDEVEIVAAKIPVAELS
ncbi:hypothetical protein C0995_015295, partial [Termitomyces sp. Mi166